MINSGVYAQDTILFFILLYYYNFFDACADYSNQIRVYPIITISYKSWNLLLLTCNTLCGWSVNMISQCIIILGTSTDIYRDIIVRKQSLAQGLNPWHLLRLLFQIVRFNQHKPPIRCYVKKCSMISPMPFQYWVWLDNVTWEVILLVEAFIRYNIVLATYRM